ncbi:hypothetical protein GQ44DRAFT_747394 [Phaeosphaeriaceae sp. PMI808]|nr:hypothetical protein GQ44DRAFT_747394 [Phaeosphaeriaceae sp. PMI808]
MQAFNLFGLMAAIATVIYAAPPLPGCAVSATPKKISHQYILQEPWHKRHLVALPSSHRLGLENFTVQPSTPPLKFLPIQLSNGNWALRGEGGNSDQSKTPYLAALKSTSGTHTVSMAIIYMPSLSLIYSKATPSACPATYECIANQRSFDGANSDMIRTNFRFAGFDRGWKPSRDAGKEGWHVYWKGNAGLYHSIQLDLVPANWDDNCTTDNLEN